MTAARNGGKRIDRGPLFRQHDRMRTFLVRAVLTACALLTLAGVAAAQEDVTILRRGGERIAGRFEAWTRQTDTVYVRVSQPDQRKFPMADVMVIDVGGRAENFPANERDAARGADHVLVTRSGEVLKGRLVNIEGGQGSASENEPRTVTFQAGSERRFKMTEVARIYLGRFSR